MKASNGEKDRADRIYQNIIKDLNQGDVASADAKMKSLEKIEKDSARVLDLKGIFRMLQNDNAGAEKLFNSAVEKAPSNPSYLLNLGNLYFGMSDWSKSKTAYEKCLQIRNDYAPALNNLAMALIRLKEYDSALSVTGRIKEAYPTHPASYRMESVIHYERGDYEKALETADKNLALDGNNPETFIQMGEIFNKLERHEDAVTAFRKAVELEPDNIDNMLSLALACGNARQFESAFAVLQKILKLAPDNQVALEGISLIYSIMGDDEKADEYRKKAEKKQKR